jgi:hypothetical protein
MGMDVYGLNATNETGRYFRRNVWGWRPLWEYCIEMSDLAASVENRFSNGGDGLRTSEEALQLATTLRQTLKNGVAATYIQERNDALENLEWGECSYCHSSGIRTDNVGVVNGMPERELSPEKAKKLGRTHGTCNACDGEGKTPPFALSYYLDLDDIAEFADFLEECGGFEIC